MPDDPAGGGPHSRAPQAKRATASVSASCLSRRTRIARRSGDGPRSTGELAGMFELGRPAVSEHLAVLRTAGLVREEPRGRHRFYHLEPARLTEVSEWLHPFERYWKQRLEALPDLLDEENGT
ncbi:ArsR/SmtB family transcription factor [Streptomyces spectabilis]|nr:metalloregulator ArsR/SmtB family transcription factor [Streptomyces spectabilis]